MGKQIEQPPPAPESGEVTDHKNVTAYLGPGLLDGLERIGKARDGILIVASLLYIMGYLCWSVVAWRQGYGAVPLLDAQYFIAGVIPTIVLAGSIWCIYLLYVFIHVRLLTWVQGLSLTGLVFVHIAATLVVSLGVLMILLVYRWNVLAPVPGVGSGILLMLLANTIVDLELLYSRIGRWVLNLPRFKKASAKDRANYQSALQNAVSLLGYLAPENRYSVLLVPLVAGLFLVNVYVEEVYPNWPQALGGAAPRCARLDITVKGLSRESLRALGVAEPAIADSVEVITTPRIMVHRESGDYLLVSPRATGTTHQTIVQVRADNVQAIEWCD